MKKRICIIATLLIALTFGQTFAEIKVPTNNNSDFMVMALENPDREWPTK